MTAGRMERTVNSMELLKNTLSRFVDSGEIAGCVVRVMKDDKVAFEGGFGYADIGKR